MKYGHREVLEVKVFDEKGKLVTILNTLKESSINSSFVYIKDALLDRKLLEFIGMVEESNDNDFESEIKNKKFSTTITFKEKIDKKCKLIGGGVLRQEFDGDDIEFLFEIPNAVIARGIDFNQSLTECSEFDLYFEMKPYNEAGDLYKMHI